MARKEDFSRFYMGIDTELLDNMWLRYFVKWYIDGADKKTFKKFGTLSDNYDYAMETYLNRGDVQACISDYYKRKKDYDFISLYKTMLKKAIEGDTKSADWILKAQDSSFFKQKSKSAIDNILDGLDIKE
jgi:hypothetical protein